MTDEALIELLRRGVRAARELSADTDKLTEELAQVERAMSELRFGVPAKVPMTSGVALEFCKEGKVWRLRVWYGNVSNLLINADRATRLEAVDYLIPLIEEVVKQTELRVERVETATKTAQEILTILRAALEK